MQSRLEKLLMKVRPAFLAEALKRLFRVTRRRIATKERVYYLVDPVSHFGAEVMKTNTYEPELTEVLKTILRPGDTFIDVGANEGYFSVLASVLVKTGKVFSVEPQERLWEVIEENFKINGVKNAELIPWAFSEGPGERTLHLSFSANTGAASFEKHWKFGAGTQKVQTQSLDAFLKSKGLTKVRLIKLDCEGAELGIIKGALKMLAEQQVDFVEMDFHQDIVGFEPSLQIDKMMRESGYRFSKLKNEIWIYHRPGLESELAALGPLEDIPPLAA